MSSKSLNGPTHGPANGPTHGPANGPINGSTKNSSNVDSNDPQFESRKVDHIRLALDPRVQANGVSGLERVRLRHEAFPELNFEDVSVSVSCFSHSFQTPLFVSSMTAGHAASGELNLLLARACARRGWAMGVGSQRKELADANASAEWQAIRKQCQGVRFFGNIGVAQLIRSKTSDIRRLVDALEATAMIVHTNPLQECLQPEGTPQFAGGLKAVERLVREIGIPVIVKETGCGFSRSTLERMAGLGIAAVDVSGLGGTHWGRIEGGRSEPDSLLAGAAETYRDWGIGTVESLHAALEIERDYEVWASGGVRSGLDAAKLVAVGAKMVGLAQPILAAAIQGEAALDELMARLEYEFRMALFCTGSRIVADLRGKYAWEQTVDSHSQNHSQNRSWNPPERGQ